jgi:hypothetical protein
MAGRKGSQMIYTTLAIHDHVFRLPPSKNDVVDRDAK